ncbi:MAG: lipocalin-like domain-containing protein [Pseudorhodoplanes sp.]|uniref:lipocalin-like domain-containing protein n=1 Tax=Pseudorhodoplanes sp. TaxID=1934341 RepID=UPI003D09FEE3
MAAVIAYGGRKPIEGDRIKAPADVRAEAYATFLAYAGTYRVEQDKVIHHVVTSAYQNEVGLDQVRFYRQDGDLLYLDTVPLVRDGKPQVFRLVWQRVRER